MNNLEVYRIGSRRWIRLPIDTPLRLDHPGEMIFIKYANIKYPDGFIDRLRVEHGFGYEPEVDESSDEYNSDDASGSDLGTWVSTPLDRKGKGRAF